MTELFSLPFAEGMLYGMVMCEGKTDEDMRMLDFERAYQICKDNPQSTIYAGLAEDWYCTAGAIWRDGEPADDYCYLASLWATPVVVIDDGEPIDCYKQDDGSARGSADWIRFLAAKAQ